MIRSIGSAVLAAAILVVSLAAHAERVQSATAVYLTFRTCQSGVTACDSFGRYERHAEGGQRGEPTAHAELVDAAYGEASGDVRASGIPGAAEIKAGVTSLPSVRNGSTNILVQRYTNTSAHAETLTLSAALSYTQTVPAENAAFPADSRAYSGPSLEMQIFTIDDEFIEVGTTVDDNFAVLIGEVGPPAGYAVLKEGATAPSSNETGEGAEELALRAVLQPGDSVWFMLLLQVFAANGAVVDAGLTTHLAKSTP